MKDAKGYTPVPGTNKLRKVITKAKDLRELFGINPQTGVAERKYIPWYVSLPVISSALIGFSRRQGVYTYAQNETEAMSKAGLFWNKYFRELQGVSYADYPKLVQYDPKNAETGVVCVVLDDQDFDALWKVCQRFPRYSAGDENDPITFCTANDVDIFSLI